MESDGLESMDGTTLWLMRKVFCVLGYRYPEDICRFRPFILLFFICLYFKKIYSPKEEPIERRD